MALLLLSGIVIGLGFEKLGPVLALLL